MACQRARVTLPGQLHERLSPSVAVDRDPRGSRAVAQARGELRGELDAVETYLAAAREVVKLAHELVGRDVGRMPLLEVADAPRLHAREHTDAQAGDEPESGRLE